MKKEGKEKRSVGVVKVLRRTAGVQVAKRQLALSIMHKKETQERIPESP